MVFLALAWIWDLFIAAWRLLVSFVPWTRFKRAFVALVDRLPAPLVLLIFLVPFLIVEPLLVVATIAIAMGYVVSGAIAWIALKLLAVGLIPAIFDLTQHRLMTLPWFARAYDKVMAFHHYARPDRRPLQRGRRRGFSPMAATRRGNDKAGAGPGASCGASRRPQARKRAAGAALERVAQASRGGSRSREAKSRTLECVDRSRRRVQIRRVLEGRP